MQPAELIGHGALAADPSVFNGRSSLQHLSGDDEDTLLNNFIGPKGLDFCAIVNESPVNESPVNESPVNESPVFITALFGRGMTC